MTSEQPQSAAAIYRRLLTYASPYWKVFLLAVFSMVIYATTDVALAELLREMVGGKQDQYQHSYTLFDSYLNDFLDDRPSAARGWYVSIIREYAPWLIVLLFMVRGLFGFVTTYGMAWIGRMSIYNIRKEMFVHITMLPSRFYDKQTSGQLISKFTFNTEQVAQAVTNAVTILIRDTLTAIILLAYLLYLNASLTIILIVFAPLIIWLLSKLGRRFRKISKRIQDAMGEVTNTLQESIDGQKEIKIFGAQQAECEHFDRVNRTNRKQNLKLMATMAASVPVIQFLAAIAVASIVYLLMNSDVKTGDFIAYITAMMFLMAPLKRLTSVNAAIQKGIAAASSIFDLLDEKMEKDTGTLSPERIKGDIEYQAVSFAYSKDAEQVLNNINFKVNAGQTVALVGKSGQGKTSLVHLLTRFYDIDSGRILIDNICISELSLMALRKQVSIVSQHVTLFNDTIANNIAYGSDKSPQRDAIINAAKAAHALEFIETFTDGFDTIVGEKGSRLSGGQKQRIAIARAIFKNAPILILDEATSALDTESEQNVQSGLKELQQNRTTLVIAHRLSTIEKADVILVLDSGAIVESGTHTALLAKNGYYAKLHHDKFE